MTMTRKDFLRSIVGAGVGAVGVAALVGCGGDDGGTVTPDSPAAVCTTPAVAIQGNHGHTLTVSLADVNAGVDKTYDIMGTSTHGHSVTLTAADFTMIKAGSTRMVVSTTGGGHTHPVNVMCVS
jgi:hypothetical protein